MSQFILTSDRRNWVNADASIGEEDWVVVSLVMCNESALSDCKFHCANFITLLSFIDKLHPKILVR